MLNAEVFSAWAKELGFSAVGFCLPDAFCYSQQIVESQIPIAERRQLRFSPLDDLPQTKSIAVLLWPYLPAQENEGLFVDSYYAASNAAYHAARKLESRVMQAHCFAKANISYPAKEAAIRANMGVIGQNSLLITPNHGSRVVIILMATAIESTAAPCPLHKTGCLACGKCIKACPSGALDENGMSHPERCLRNFTLEGIVVPEALRARIGMRLIGCDICQRVCPMQPSAIPVPGKAYALEDFVTLDTARFSAAAAKLAKEIGSNAARPQRIRAQAALLAGNRKDKAHLPVLHHWAQLPFDAVREHARWAIRQIELADENT